jgi:hypothetical protein
VLATLALLSSQVHKAWSVPVSGSSGSSGVISISSTKSTHSQAGTVVNQPNRQIPPRPLRQAGLYMNHHHRMADFRGPITSHTSPNNVDSGYFTGSPEFNQHWQSLHRDQQINLLHRALVKESARQSQLKKAALESRKQMYAHHAMLQKQQQRSLLQVRPSSIVIKKPVPLPAGRIVIGAQDKGKAPIFKPTAVRSGPRPFVFFPSILHPAGSTQRAKRVTEAVVLESSTAGPSSLPASNEAKTIPKVKGKENAVRVGHARFRKAPAGQAGNEPQVNAEGQVASQEQQSSSSSSGNSQASPRVLNLFQ